MFRQDVTNAVRRGVKKKNRTNYLCVYLSKFYYRGQNRWRMSPRILTDLAHGVGRWVAQRARENVSLQTEATARIR